MVTSEVAPLQFEILCIHTCRTPARLLMVVDAILAAYEAQHASGSMLKEAAALMKPEIITRLKELQLQIRQEFT